jgi:hypothetical protein
LGGGEKKKKKKERFQHFWKNDIISVEGAKGTIWCNGPSLAYYPR